MKTFSDEILHAASCASRDAVSLAGQDHSREDYKSLLKRLGSVVEVFLKDHVYVGAHNRWTFQQSD